MTSNFCTMLPLELRQDIYELVFRNSFISPQPSRYDCLSIIRRRAGGFRRRKASEALALLFVNRQISSEAWPFFFSKTKFKCIHGMIFKWLKGLGPITKSLITTLEVTIETLDVADVDVLSTMPSLRTVNILMSGFFDDEDESVDNFTKHFESPGRYDVCIYNLCLKGPPSLTVGVWQSWSRAKGHTAWERNQILGADKLIITTCDTYWAKDEGLMRRAQVMREMGIATPHEISPVYTSKIGE